LLNSSPTHKTLIVIAGPTAVGKTALSIDLAKKLQTDILSADSRQFYKELSIGTAKPTGEEMQGVTHHFIDNKSITEHYSAGMFEKDAIALLDEYFKDHAVAIMCGGSGMYIDAVCKGMDTFEETDEQLRAELNEKIKTNGLGWLQQQVKQLDPVYYGQVDKQNPARLQRALEVCIATGRPYSSYRKGEVKKRNFAVCRILLDMDRALLYDRINERVDLMMKQGLLKEAESVFAYRHMKALNTVGYKELFNYMEGKHSLERAVELIKQNTRRYAKRQLTWFNNDAEYRRFEQPAFDKIWHLLAELHV
jgi:tRNA dimethylallyltransferase